MYYYEVTELTLKSLYGRIWDGMKTYLLGGILKVKIKLTTSYFLNYDF